MANLLVVEDEQSLLHTLRYNLSRAGHEVRLSTDGRRALEMVRENPPDLMLLDLMLPGMDGLEMCRHVRREVATPAVRRLPILVLTRERILRNVWGYEYAGDTRTVDVHVRWLRGKIEPDPAVPRRIETVRGVGYLFTG